MLFLMVSLVCVTALKCYQFVILRRIKGNELHVIMVIVFTLTIKIDHTLLEYTSIHDVVTQ